MLFTIAIAALIAGLVLTVWPFLASYLRQGETKDHEHIMTAFGIVMLILGFICLLIDLIT